MTPKSVNRSLWVLLSLLVIGALGGLYFIDQSLNQIAQNTAKLKADSEINQKKTDIYEVSKQKVQSLDYVNSLAEQILPGKHNQSTTIAELSQFALRSNLGVADITFDIPDPAQTKKSTQSKKDKDDKTKRLPKGVEIIPVTLTLKEGARYNNVLTFLKTLENNRRKMQVATISLTPSEIDGTILEQVSFRIHIYAQKATESEGDE